ncbi:MAG: hypothetical protein V2A71_05835 [Candidatus Eisenbacteria bacterium]
MSRHGLSSPVRPTSRAQDAGGSSAAPRLAAQALHSFVLVTLFALPAFLVLALSYSVGTCDAEGSAATYAVQRSAGLNQQVDMQSTSGVPPAPAGGPLPAQIQSTPSQTLVLASLDVAPAAGPFLLATVAYGWDYPGLGGAKPVSKTDQNARQRWYNSIFTQQQLISQQVHEMRVKLGQNLLTTDEFLDTVTSLVERVDRLYAHWKRVGARSLSAGPLAGPSAASADAAFRAALSAASFGSSPGASLSTSLGSASYTDPAAFNTNLASPSPADTAAALGTQKTPQPAMASRRDAAVGKSLNYLKLSLLNLFLGYCDSNGSQIADADEQEMLSRLWRTRSIAFVREMEQQAR